MLHLGPLLTCLTAFSFLFAHSLASTNLSFLGEITVKTWVHIIAEDRTFEQGWVSDEQVQAQMIELKSNFAPQNIKFVLEGITRTVNADWANDGLDVGWIMRAEYEYKTALRKGDYKTLNVYVVKYISQGRGPLGFATFPDLWYSDPRHSQFVLDGVVIRHDSLPGGTNPVKNLGRTLTHETGHWFGLLHTFETQLAGDDPCKDPDGDFIADTPRQNGSTSGCPISRDSCPDQPGLDPIHNYMDYSDDLCRKDFTPLQTKRMFDQWYQLRSPRVCRADNCLRALRSPVRKAESKDFCEEFTKLIVEEVSLVKSYAVEACTGNVLSRVSSACSCLVESTSVTFQGI